MARTDALFSARQSFVHACERGPAGHVPRRPLPALARTAWHAHPRGQTIYVTEGIGLVQRRGVPVEVIRPGDRVFFEPGEDHWHGATPDRFMTHLAMVDARNHGRRGL